MKFKKSWLVVSALTLCLSPFSGVQAQSQEHPTETLNLSNKVDVLRASDIRYYKTLPVSPEKAKSEGLEEHTEAIELVAQQYFLDTGKKIEVDFDNIGYQNYVMSLGSAFDLFKEEDMKKIVSFVKFMDLYENYAKNDEIAKYERKLLQKTQLSVQETVEVLSLLPIDYNAPATADNSIETTSLVAEANSNEVVNDVTIQTVFSNGYDNIEARDYAYLWWNDRNPIYSTYYAEKKGCEVSDKCWQDCANFVSQSLYAGGMNFVFGTFYWSDDSWHFGPLVPSHTWGGAASFYRHWSNRAGVASTVSDLQTGDAVNYDAANDGDPDHTAIITKNTGSNSNNKYLTQHTIDRKETTTLKNWYDAGYIVYGYEIDKASN